MGNLLRLCYEGIDELFQNETSIEIELSQADKVDL